MLADFDMNNTSKHRSLANDSFYLLCQFGHLVFVLLGTQEDLLTAL